MVFARRTRDFAKFLTVNLFHFLAVKFNLSYNFITKNGLEGSISTLNQIQSTLFTWNHARNHKILSFKMNFSQAPHFWRQFWLILAFFWAKKVYFAQFGSLMHGIIWKLRQFSKRYHIYSFGVFWVFFIKKFQSWKKSHNLNKFWSTSNNHEKLFFWKQTIVQKPFMAQNAVDWLPDSTWHPNMAFPENIDKNHHFCEIIWVILGNFWNFRPSRWILWLKFDITLAVINIFSKFKNLNNQWPKDYTFKDILGD